MPPDEVLIRKRAYEIWEKENRPHGRDREHWDEALRQIAVENAAALPASPAKPARKPATAAPGSAASEPAEPAKRAHRTAGGDAPAPRRRRSKQPA